MPILETAGKATLFGTSISVISAGVALIKENFQAGLMLLVIGVALVIIWATLIERQSKQAGEQAAQKTFEKLKMELQKKKEKREKA